MKAPAPLLIAFFASCACGGGRQQPTAQDTACRFVEASGGREVLEAVQVIHTIDSLEVAGLSGTSEAWWQREPFMGHVVVEIGPVRQELLIRGDSVWSVDRNGMLADGDEMSLMQARMARLTVFYDAFLEPSGLGAAPDTLVDGVESSRILLEGVGSDPVTLFVSKEDWLPVMVHMRVMGMDVYSRPAGYRSISGVVSASRSTESIPALGQETASRNILTEYNVPVPADVFALAGEGGDWALDTPGEPYPFRLDVEHIFLAGRIGELPVDVILDSGAGATVLDSATAVELGIVSEGDFSALGVGGSSSFGFAEVPEYSAAGAKVTGQTVAVLPLSGAFLPGTGHRIGLILGYDFLSRFVTEIDYGARTIRLLDPDAGIPAGGESIPAERILGVLAVDVVLEDSIEARLLLDTGAGGAIHFTPAFLENHPAFLADRTTLPTAIQGIGGMDTALVFRVGSLKLGSFETEAGLCSSGGELAAASGFDGILGNAVLARFVVTLDYGAPAVHLAPSSLFETGLPENGCGLGAVIGSGGLEISEVLPGSPADSAGLKPGDGIVSADGYTLGPDDFNLLDSLVHGPAGTSLVLGIEGSEGPREVELVLRRLL